MASPKWLSPVLGVALVGLSAQISPARSVSDADKKMYVTFNRPVALPGLALGSGTYIFELPDPVGAWDFVRVSSQDRRIVYLTVFTRLIERPAGMDPSQPVSVGEAPANNPQPITAWWPANES